MPTATTHVSWRHDEAALERDVRLARALEFHGDAIVRTSKTLVRPALHSFSA